MLVVMSDEYEIAAMNSPYYGLLPRLRPAPAATAEQEPQPIEIVPAKTTIEHLLESTTKTKIPER